jgi:serine protease Do
MKRAVALALGVGAVALAGLASGPAARAGEKADQKAAGKAEQKVEQKAGEQKREVVIRHAGGGFLGIGLGDLEGEARGAKVQSVESGSAADKAGIKEGDVIVRFDGETVRSAAQLSRLVGETPAGRSVPLEVTRGGATQKLTATLGERRMRVFEGRDFPGMHQFQFELPEPPEPPEAPSAPGAPRAPRAPRAWSWNFGEGGDRLPHLLPGLGPRKLGLEYIDMGEQLAAAYKLSGKGGVLVTSVDADGPAAKAGVKAGDVILKFDGRTIGDASDLRDAVAAAEGGKEVALSVQRDGRALDLKATLAKAELPRHRRSGDVRL